MAHQPALDVLDDLRKLAHSPYYFNNADMMHLANRAIEEIEMLREAIAIELARGDAEPEGRA